jgi:16S rRNA processing protein RimM
VELVVGRVGRPHGVRGEVTVEVRTDDPDDRFSPGRVLATDPAESGPLMVEQARWHSGGRLLIRFAGIDDRGAAEALRGAELVADEDAPAAPGEWDASELVGCEVPGIGSVRRVVAAPSCDLLEVGDAGVLVPFVSDAIRRVDPAAGVIEADLRFLGLEDEDAP